MAKLTVLELWSEEDHVDADVLRFVDGEGNQTSERFGGDNDLSDIISVGLLNILLAAVVEQFRFDRSWYQVFERA